MKKYNHWVIAGAVLLATFMEVMDTSIANVSLPHIAGSLSATSEEATWVLTSYLVANGIVLPITAWLAGRFGRKNYLLFSIALFTVASILCGAAPSLPMLVVFRIIQGFGGGGLQPLSQAIILEEFPPEKRGQGMAAFGLGVVVAPILGPILGGWITDNYSWRWIFYVNLPIGILALFLVNLVVTDPAYIKKSGAPIDYMGLGFLAIGIGALQYVLDRGQENDWFGNPTILWLSVIAAACIIFLIAWELLAPHPIMNLRIFKKRSFAVGVFLMTMLGLGLYGNLVLLPLFLQILLGYPAMEAGLATSPRGVGSFLAMPIAGILLGIIEPRPLIAAGGLVAGYSIYLLSKLNLNAAYWNIFWPQILQGFSMALLFVPITTATMGPVANEEMGNATSLFNLMRNLGGSFGISLATTLLDRLQQIHQSYLAADVSRSSINFVNVSHRLSNYFLFHGYHPALTGNLASGMVYRTMTLQAATLAYTDCFRIFSLFFFAFLPLVFLLDKAKPKKGGIPAAH